VPITPFIEHRSPEAENRAIRRNLFPSPDDSSQESAAISSPEEDVPANQRSVSTY